MSDTYDPGDIERIQELVGALRGAQLGEVDDALGENRDGVLILAKKIGGTSGLVSPAAVFVSALRRGEHKRRIMSTSEDGKGPQHPQRVPAAEALRRLYDAKLAELTGYGMPEVERIPLAVDYACGEVWRCSIQPMPEGGIVRLEDELYRAVGFDRVSGVRFPPQTRA